jgi:D-proline reductase (dithiol) PrdB
VGLLARLIEACGVTTVGLALGRDVALAARAPRLLCLRWPFGHVLGETGNGDQQRTVLRNMFAMARLAPYPGLVVTLPYRWRRERYQQVVDWAAESDALALARAEAMALQHDGVPDQAVAAGT